MGPYKTGTLAIYKTASAVVTGISGDKIAIRTESGDTKNVREKDLQYLHPGPVSALPPKRLADPDLAEMAELMAGEPMSFADFAELLFGSFSADAAWSARALILDGIYFQQSPDGMVSPRPEEEIQKTLSAIREKEELKEKHQALLNRIRSGSLLPEDRPSLSEIEMVARGINPSSHLMHELGIEALPQKAHSLLLKLGIWDLTVNPHPERFGIDRKAPDIKLPEEEVRPMEREDLTAQTAYAIDDEGSQDPDDAIVWDAAKQLLWVHIADPASVFDFDSDVDLEARARGENLYLPEQLVLMLPQETTPRFGLGLHDVSPAISFAIRFDDTGIPSLERMTLSKVHVQRLTYQTADRLMATPEMQELREKLELFQQYRRDHGALFIRMPEVKIRYQAPDISITPLPITPERELVAQSMLAAGFAVGKWAEEREIPMPFVSQEAPDPTLERGDSLPQMFALRKGCQQGVTTPYAGLHAGLGLEPYIRVTSPLRRYSDLLAHYQLHRCLAGDEPLTDDDLAAALAISEPAAALRHKTERFSNEYWTLVYLSRMTPDWTTDAVFVYKQDDRMTFLLPELAYEYKNRFGGEMVPGDVKKVSLLSVEPATFTLRLKIVS